MGEQEKIVGRFEIIKEQWGKVLGHLIVVKVLYRLIIYELIIQEKYKITSTVPKFSKIHVKKRKIYPKLYIKYQQADN